MKIAYITSGAAGMFCGSCMHDNTLVSALIAQGHEALLMPTYTPIRTDETDISSSRVFFGGINVYLQQKSALFRWTPWWLDRLLDANWLLRWVSKFAVKTQADQLAALFISMLKGNDGRQRKEIKKLVTWLRNEYSPQIVHLSNVLLSGIVPAIKSALKVPVVATMQGDDIFLETLPEDLRKQAIDLVRKNCEAFDGFTATSNYYADFMAEYLGIPRAKIEVIYPGLNLKGYSSKRLARTGRPFTIGYFARICPEKGFHQIVEAFHELKQMPDTPPCKLRVSGWLGDHNRAYFNEWKAKIDAWGLAGDFEYVETPDHASKARFYQSIDLLSVPTIYREPKGIYILEALANGVPVVQPWHGSFPELIQETGGGALFTPGNIPELAQALRHLMMHPDELQFLADQAREVIERKFTAGAMASETLKFYRKFVP